MKDIKDMLIVEDGKENIEAATEYFQSLKDTRVDIVKNYAEALDRIKNGFYDSGIFDLQIPEKEGEKPLTLGHLLMKEAIRYYTPSSFAIATSGIDHHNSYGTQVYAKYAGDTAPGDLVGNPKNTPETWSIIYERVSHSPDLDSQMKNAVKEYKEKNGTKATMPDELFESVYETVLSSLSKSYGFKDKFKNNL